jgi:hypothetical protein
LFKISEKKYLFIYLGEDEGRALLGIMQQFPMLMITQERKEGGRH